MVANLAHNWWALALRGLAAIIFGILAFIWPGGAFTVLVWLFGAYALWDGIFSIVAAIRRRNTASHWWALLLEGIVGIIAGLIAFFYTGIAGLALLYLIAGWALVTGILEMVSAVRLRREITGEWALFLSGLLSVVFGILIAIFPGAGILTVIWLIAAYAILFGILMIILAFRLRSHAGRVLAV